MAVDIIEVTSSGCSNITVTSNNSPSISVSSAVASCGGGSIDTSNFYTNDNPSGFITAAQAGGVLNINGLSGFVNLTGINNQIFISGQYIFISGISGNTNSMEDAVSTGDLIKYNTFLTSGLETEFINYPVTFISKPTTVHCEFENDRDNLTYLHSISGVNNNGFFINFSDFLSNSGYKLHITINK